MADQVPGCLASRLVAGERLFRRWLGRRQGRRGRVAHPSVRRTALTLSWHCRSGPSLCRQSTSRESGRCLTAGQGLIDFVGAAWRKARHGERQTVSSSPGWSLQPCTELPAEVPSRTICLAVPPSDCACPPAIAGARNCCREAVFGPCLVRELIGRGGGVPPGRRRRRIREEHARARAFKFC